MAALRRLAVVAHDGAQPVAQRGRRRLRKGREELALHVERVAKLDARVRLDGALAAVRKARHVDDQRRRQRLDGHLFVGHILVQPLAARRHGRTRRRGAAVERHTLGLKVGRQQALQRALAVALGGASFAPPLSSSRHSGRGIERQTETKVEKNATTKLAQLHVETLKSNGGTAVFLVHSRSQTTAEQTRNRSVSVGTNFVNQTRFCGVPYGCCCSRVNTTAFFCAGPTSVHSVASGTASSDVARVKSITPLLPLCACELGNAPPSSDSYRRRWTNNARADVPNPSNRSWRAAPPGLRAARRAAASATSSKTLGRLAARCASAARA